MWWEWEPEIHDKEANNVKNEKKEKRKKKKEKEAKNLLVKYLGTFM